MHDSAQILLGEHDFSSFRAVGCQAKSAQRNLHNIEVTRPGDLVYLDVKANAFLYHMVRNIAGSLISIGRGEHDAKWLEQVFAARDRNQAEITAPAAGLYFVQVWYESEYKLPTQAQKPVLF